jgi:SPP1 gp7 family putative phage head morphogenesis protein
MAKNLTNEEYWIDRAIVMDKHIRGQEGKINKTIVGAYEDTEQEIIDIVTKEYAKYGTLEKLPYNQKRFVSMYSEVSGKLDDLYGGKTMNSGGLQTDVFKSLTDGLNDGYSRNMFDVQKGMNFGKSFNMLNDTAISNVLSNPWSGDNYSDRLYNNKKKLQQVLKQEIRTSIIRGNGAEKTAREIGKRMDKATRQTRTLARTELNYVYNEGKERAYKFAGVEQYEYVATLDNRTSDLDREIDGNVYNLDEKVIGVNWPPLHPNCYQKGTQIYTNQGWKLFEDLDGTELFLSINPDNIEEYEWIKANKHIAYNHQGKMINFKTANLDLTVTPNHRMLTLYYGKRSSGNWRFVDAENYPKSKNKMFRGLYHEGSEQVYKLGNYKIEPELYMKFMAWYLSDGSTSKRSSVSYNCVVTQFTHVDLMYETLIKLPFKVSKTSIGISILDKSVAKELHKYGKCNEKYAPQIIKDSTPELIKVFLNAYAIADGHTKKGKMWKGYQFNDSVEFFTTSTRLADDLSELVLKAGGRPYVKLQKNAGKTVEFSNGEYTLNYDCWRIAWNKKVFVHSDNIQVTEVDYDGMVYCVELEKWNTILVRKNGHILWSGNCRGTTTPHFPDAPATEKRIARDVETGKSFEIPASESYKDWQKKYQKPPVATSEKKKEPKLSKVPVIKVPDTKVPKNRVSVPVEDIVVKPTKAQEKAIANKTPLKRWTVTIGSDVVDTKGTKAEAVSAANALRKKGESAFIYKSDNYKSLHPKRLANSKFS